VILVQTAVAMAEKITESYHWNPDLTVKFIQAYRR